MSRLFTIVSSEPDASDLALRKLAEFLGLAAESVDLSDFSPNGTREETGVAAMSGRTLTLLFERANATADQSKLRLLPRGTLLVRGFANCDAPGLLALLTNGALTGLRSVAAGRQTFSYTEALPRSEIPLAGLSQSVEPAREVTVFVQSKPATRLVNLVLVEQQPLFARIRCGDTEIFLLSDGAPVAQIDARCDSNEACTAANATLLHPAIFFRMVFGSACWTNPFPAANLVIDDPMIRRRYGAIEYRRLLAEARAHGYAVTIAFIPFNHRRSDRRTAEFLVGHRNHFSLAVHGCDHTREEFGADDDQKLLHISRLAITRMRAHETLTAMPFDPVMVFPQGVFSAPAFKALKRSGYNAVVNTEVLPRNRSQQPELTVRDWLDGANPAYSGFPLFRRRYPTSIFDFAVDLLWGKPVLLVEHHGYFRDGYAHFSAFARQLGQLVPKLDWKPLGEVVGEHAVFRPLPDGRFAVKFFTPTFRLKNPTPTGGTFCFEKNETEPDQVDQVTVNGQRTDFKIVANVLRGKVELPGSGEAVIKIGYRPTPDPTYRLSSRHRYSAAARRYMSEVRDNYIARNSRIYSVAIRLKGLLRGSR